jgi:hypothetical protein
VEPVSKMASQLEKAFRVLGFEVSRSVITVQREFRARFAKDAPHKNNASEHFKLINSLISYIINKFVYL